MEKAFRRRGSSAVSAALELILLLFKSFWGSEKPENYNSVV